MRRTWVFPGLRDSDTHRAWRGLPTMMRGHRLEERDFFYSIDIEVPYLFQIQNCSIVVLQELGALGRHFSYSRGGCIYYIHILHIYSSARDLIYSSSARKGGLAYMLLTFFLSTHDLFCIRYITFPVFLLSFVWPYCFWGGSVVAYHISSSVLICIK